MSNHFTAPAPASLLLRLGLAIIFLSHGGLKIAFGSAKWSSETLPAGIQVAVAWGEVVVGLACLIGLLTRLACLGIIVIMIGAMWLETGQRNFIDITFDLPSIQVSNRVVGFNRISPGYEYNFAICVMASALILLGSGPYSVDSVLWRRRRGTAVSAGMARPAGTVEAPTPPSHAPA